MPQYLEDFLLITFLDLRKFRTYHGAQVRDLLRAMRNKVYYYDINGKVLNLGLIIPNNPLNHIITSTNFMTDYILLRSVNIKHRY